MPAIVEIQDLRVHRGGTPILRGVSWTIESGEHWVVLGPNGSGKSSLLAALTGYLTPTAGVLRLLGKTYGEDHWPHLRRRVGLVSHALQHLMADDEPALETVASGRSAAIDLWHRPSRVDRRRAMALLRRVRCVPLAYRPWVQLSQGERQRVLIARALMAGPAILILDEPCAGLDPCGREHFLQFLDRLGRSPSSPTLVLVTHHVEEIVPVFTHALLLRRGLASACGPIGQTLTSASLSAAFDTRLRLRRTRGRFALGVPPAMRSRGL